MIRSQLATYLPWLLSAITIYSTVLAGNKHRHAWLVSLAGQAGWLAFIIASGSWGFLPLTITLTVLYLRNHVRWKSEAPVASPLAMTMTALAEERDHHFGGSSYDASLLRELLARIHGDGGHYVAEHGIDKAVTEAEALVAQWRAGSMAEAYAGALEDLEGWKRIARRAEEAAHRNSSRFVSLAALTPLPLAVMNLTVEEEAQALIARAEKEGKVVVIETKPLQPLAMGHYKMVADVRDARVRAEPIRRSHDEPRSPTAELES